MPTDGLRPADPPAPGTGHETLLQVPYLPDDPDKWAPLDAAYLGGGGFESSEDELEFAKWARNAARDGDERAELRIDARRVLVHAETQGRPVGRFGPYSREVEEVIARAQTLTKGQARRSSGCATPTTSRVV